MNVAISTALKGQYTVYDENMNMLSESDNLITDWGMRRFVGDRAVGTVSDQPAVSDGSILAFCNNFSQIFLGTGSSTPSVSSWKLDSIIPASEYSISTHRSTTGTSLSTAPNGDLAIIFTNVQRFKFNNLLSQPSYILRELGCNWSSTFAQNNRYGIFSRAIIPAIPIITITANSTIYVKYKLTIVTDSNQIKGSMFHDARGNAVPFPNNKTNVRRLPLYAMKDDATPSSLLNEGVTIDPPEYVQPLFEDMQLWNYSYVGTGGTGPDRCGYRYMEQSYLLGTAVGGGDAYKVWWLQFYRSSYNYTNSLSATNGGANPLQRYTEFISTTSTLSGNSSSIAASPQAGTTDYSLLIQQQLSLNSNTQGRKPADSCTIAQTNSNTWVRTISFVFAPEELGSNITVYKLYPATLGNASNRSFRDCGNSYIGQGAMYFDNAAVHNFGVVTVLDAPYTPASNNFVGFQYQFVFKRN